MVHDSPFFLSLWPGNVLQVYVHHRLAQLNLSHPSFGHRLNYNKANCKLILDQNEESKNHQNVSKPKKIEYHVDSLKINKTEVRRRSLNDRVESSSGLIKCAKDALNQAYLNQIPRIELDTVLKPRRKSADHGKEWVIRVINHFLVEFTIFQCSACKLRLETKKFHSTERLRNLKRLILLSKNLNRDHLPRKNSMQMDLDGIQLRQNSNKTCKILVSILFIFFLLKQWGGNSPYFWFLKSICI